MFLEEGTFGIFPAYLCKGMDPYKQTILSWLWFHKNKEGKCHPSQGTLCEECGMSHTTLNVKLAELESAGLIKRRVMKKDDMSNFNTEYELLLVKGSTPNGLGGSTPNGLRSPPNGQEPKPYSVCPPASQTSILSPAPPEVERSTGGTGTEQERSREKLTDELFEAFWKKYPRREGKAKSRQIMSNLMKKHSYRKIMDGLDWYLAKWKKEGTEVKFIPMPTTWLNGERFCDAPEKRPQEEMKRAVLPPVTRPVVTTMEELDLSVI